MTKVLALDADGNLSYCSVPEDQRSSAKGCTHISHVVNGQSVKDFIKNSQPETSERPSYSPELPLRMLPKLEGESDEKYKIREKVHENMEFVNRDYDKPWEKLIRSELNEYDIDEFDKRIVISLMKLGRRESAGVPMEYYKTVNELTNNKPSSIIPGLPKKLREEIDAYVHSCFYSVHFDETTSFETLTASRVFIDEKKREKIGIPK